jgi:hypothetical protein
MGLLKINGESNKDRGRGINKEDKGTGWIIHPIV